MDLAELRKDYRHACLLESDLLDDPIEQFHHWLDQALRAEVVEPYAMTLATCSPDGWPSARIVLLRRYSQDGFAFFTNYEGRKARDLADNPRAALVFYWAELERQVRIEGTVEQTSPEESDDYFRSRPRGHQLGAWASKQSEVIAGRAVLEERLAELERQYADRDVPRPPFWGGYRVRPIRIEFWQGRLNRLHDRILYRRAESGGWIRERLSP
jgi:pyridoxamine 5'-phosphate oxidase